MEKPLVTAPLNLKITAASNAVILPESGGNNVAAFISSFVDYSSRKEEKFNKERHFIDYNFSTVGNFVIYIL